jgi:Outer membrane protein beta-barrel domain
MRLIQWAFGLVVVGAMLGWVNPAAAQSKRQKIKNLPQYDERNWRYGFQLGVHRSRYNIRHDAFYAANGDSTTAIYPTWTPGFMVGLILSKRLGSELWNLRFTPNVTFYERTIRYEFNNNIDKPRPSSFEQTTVEFPLLVKYKSVRRLNNRMYMLAGLTPAFTVGSRRQRLNDQALQIRNFNLEINYGFGFDLYFEMFKFAPEIRFSHGVPNLLIRNGNLFSNNLDRVTTHRVALILNFE